MAGSPAAKNPSEVLAIFKTHITGSGPFWKTHFHRCQFCYINKEARISIKKGRPWLACSNF